MHFDSYEYLWAPQRPIRTKEEIGVCAASNIKEKLGDVFSYKDRLAARCLMYSVIDNVNLRNIFDGFLLPPPFHLADFAEKRWTAKDVADAVQTLNPCLDGIIVLMPFNVSLRLGGYDARLRAACQRLCWVLRVPFSIVEEQEARAAELYAELIFDEEAGSGAACEMLSIEARRKKRLNNIRRTAVIGGFAVLGGSALVLTGGLAAPLVGSAFAALTTAVSTTAGAIATFGSAILGAGVLASVFVAVVGVATHAAALAAMVTPLLTPVAVTAVFGVGGATLAGFKAYRRTGDSDVFVIRSIEEVEEFPIEAETGSLPAGEVQPEDERMAGEAKKALLPNWDLLGIVEDDSRPGIVGPSHTRTVTMANVGSIDTIAKRNRPVIFSIDCQLPGYELRLKAMKLVVGVWALTPPPVIPAGQSGVFACMNRFMHPTGAGFVLCYVATPVRTPVGSAAVRVWVRVHYSLLRLWELSAFCEGVDKELDPFKAEMRLEAEASKEDFSLTHRAITMQMQLRPFAYLKLYPPLDAAAHAVQCVTFPCEELAQRCTEVAHAVRQKRRRTIGVALVNKSKHSLYVRDVSLVNGAQWPQTPLPVVVEPRTASISFFANSDWSLQGAEGFYILEVRNANEQPFTPTFFVRLQFKVSALNAINVAVATAPTMTELKQMELWPTAPAAMVVGVPLRQGLFFALNVCVLKEVGAIELEVQNFVERRVNACAVVKRAAIVVGVCGYSTTYDPRRPSYDQQVGLWQSALRNASVVGASERYVVQWEDEYLSRFGETINLDLDLTDRFGDKAIGELKDVAKSRLMQGAIFSGLHAFNALLGTFKMPLYAIWAMDVIDNTFATLSNRAVFAGKDLAKALLDTRIGQRPVTLIGFSFGSKVVAECLLELDRIQAYNIVENVFMLGSTLSANTDLWRRLRRATAGRLVNVYTRRDWVLEVMYKANEHDLKPMAGVTPVNLAGIENVDVTPVVVQHSFYGLKLRAVLDLIPLEPTEKTWSKKTLRGSPGVVVPSSTCKETLRTMGRSLSSVFSRTPFCAVAIANSLVTDAEGLDLSLELVYSATFNGFFDFHPPAMTLPSTASVCGAVGESSANPLGGALTYRLRLGEFSERDLVFTVFFYVERNDKVDVVVEPNLLRQRNSPQETEEEASERLCCVTAEALGSIEDLQRICSAAKAVRAKGTKRFSQSVELPLRGFFKDAHRCATVFLKTERAPGGALVNVLALLTRASSQLEGEQFTEELFATHHPHSAASEADPEMPTMSSIHNVDHMQTKLMEMATTLSKDSIVLGDPPRAMSIVKTPIVIVNSSDIPLVFVEESLQGAGNQAPGAATPLMHPLTWLRTPPPELPPHSFCVALLRRDTPGRCVQVRYEINDGRCAFDIVATQLTPAEGSSGSAGTLSAAAWSVRCHAVPGRSHDTDGATASVVDIDGVAFHLVVLSPHVSNKADIPLHMDDPLVQDAFRSYGWFIA